ncbi:uncharacterized protein BDZ83DRAFT_334520 [Colletotrichum acutatum]|uniref:Uncharacterized protein n=1 Tax=Glomerella acutata TaxID=27357 RepID=A0AAD9D2P3_GLOAC|nr:uncharacterized protein BDZ83DRAFT_334520 [Colletotrichum acutatum]KAK1730766.1 hypothetical protein BDZ83DRAFT_334520 [Colletotrichum acutatum]
MSCMPLHPAEPSCPPCNRGQMNGQRCDCLCRPESWPAAPRPIRSPRCPTGRLPHTANCIVQPNIARPSRDP